MADEHDKTDGEVATQIVDHFLKIINNNNNNNNN